MDYKIRAAASKNYIVLKIYSDITLEHAREFTRELAAMVESSKIQNIFVDARGVRNVISTFDNYTYAYKEMAELGLRQNIRSACLIDPHDKSHNFVETVIQNAGYVTRMFTNENESIDWLFQDESNSASNKAELINLLKTEF